LFINLDVTPGFNLVLRPLCAISNTTFTLRQHNTLHKVSHLHSAANMNTEKPLYEAETGRKQSLQATTDVNMTEAPVTWKAYLLCAFASFGGIFFG
jgi:hypothetical protein